MTNKKLTQAQQGLAAAMEKRNQLHKSGKASPAELHQADVDVVRRQDECYRPNIDNQLRPKYETINREPTQKKLTEANQELVSATVRRREIQESDHASKSELIQADMDVNTWMENYSRLNKVSRYEVLYEQLNQDCLPKIITVQDEIDQLNVPSAKQQDKEAVSENLNAIISQIGHELSKGIPESISEDDLKRLNFGKINCLRVLEEAKNMKMIFQSKAIQKLGGEGKKREFDAAKGFDPIIAKQIYDEALKNEKCGVSAVAKHFKFGMTTARERLKEHSITKPQRKRKTKKLRA